ncbi:MAG: O-antigen ligase family protein [Bryobacterales bacterium]|nr:O-antigen ligase family protein [Bryobacterales bacterium]
MSPSVRDASAAAPVRTVAALTAILVVFYHFSNIAELLATVTGVNFRLIYILTLFAVIAVVSTGAIQNALRHRAVVFYLLFVGWMILAVPFSTWIGGTLGALRLYLMVSVPLIFIVGGLLIGWESIRGCVLAIALSGVVVTGNTLVFGVSRSGDRLSLSSSGMIGNSNDLASHLVFMMPVLAFVGMDRSRNWFVRLLCIGCVPVTLVLILQTGSRGALLGLAMMVVVALWKSPVKVRFGIIAASVVLALLSTVWVPDTIKNRLTNFNQEMGNEAEESALARRNLFDAGVRYSLQRPIFGVGLAQFPIFHGQSRRAAGIAVPWHASHCTWVDISSECGIPALLFMLAAIGTALHMLSRTYLAAQRSGQVDIAGLCLSVLVAFASFLMTITFLSNGYRFYLPTMIGLSVAIAAAAEAELARRSGSEERPMVNA